MKKYFIRGINTMAIATLVMTVVFMTAFALYITNYSDYRLSDEELSFNTSSITEIYTMEFTDRAERVGTPSSEPFEELYASRRIWTPYEQFPHDLINAFIAIEDHRFYEHKGVDFARTAKAVLNYLFPFEERTFGGSTITQQLIKNVTGNNRVKIKRKIEEIFSALDLEKRYTKNEIMEMYLNIVYLSENTYGVGAASDAYFGKSPSELSLEECAALAAIVQNPSRYDPYLYPEANAERRNLVLTEMLRYGSITPDEYEAASEAELVLSENLVKNRNPSVYSWYTETVIDDVIRDLMETYGYAYEKASRMVFSGGLKIYTLMDPYVQSVVEDVYFDLHFSDGLQSAFVVTDPYTGDVLGLCGGVGEKNANLILNRATGTFRSPGSTIKPLSVYALALDRKMITYGSVYDDIPTEITQGRIWPQNATHVYSGLTTVNNAVVCSLNTVPVQLVKKLGTTTVFHFLKDKLRLDSLTERKELPSGKVVTDNALAPLALGQLSYGISLREMTAAYGIFPADGVMRKSKTYFRVLDAHGNVILEEDQSAERVIAEETAAIMTMMLKNVVDYGTARRITMKNKIAVAGKTGTSGEDYDKWLIAYSPYYVGGVWVGYDTPQKVKNNSAYLTCRLWDRVMERLHENIPGSKNRKFKIPDGVVKVRYCKDSGCLMTEACELDPRGCRAEVGYFTKDTVPRALCTRHRLVEINGENGNLATADTMPLLKRTIGLLNYNRGALRVPISDQIYLISSRKADSALPITDPSENTDYEDE